MSLSEESRLSNLNLALDLMLQELGESAIDITIFEMNAETFKKVQPTTWKELEDRRWINLMGYRTCRFTGSGWLAALDLIGFDAGLFEARLSKLAAALKDKIKGRSEDAFVYLDTLAKTSELPEPWIYNAIEARLLEHKFNMKGAYWLDERGGSPLIRIPLDFGLRPL